VSEPRCELPIESGGKYPIDDFRRVDFVLAGVSRLENDAEAIIDNLSGRWNLEVGDGEGKTSLIGVEAIEFVTR